MEKKERRQSDLVQSQPQNLKSTRQFLHSAIDAGLHRVLYHIFPGHALSCISFSVKYLNGLAWYLTLKLSLTQNWPCLGTQGLLAVNHLRFRKWLNEMTNVVQMERTCLHRPKAQNTFLDILGPIH